MLYSMLYASGDGFRRERGYIVRLLRDGVKSDAVSRLSESESRAMLIGRVRIGEYCAEGILSISSQRFISLQWISHSAV